jgi:hypothetical protein
MFWQILLWSAIIALCGSCLPFSDETTQKGLTQALQAEVSPIGKLEIPGDIYMATQFECPGRDGFAGEERCITSLRIATSRDLAPDDLLRRPFILKPDDVVLVDEFLFGDFLLSLPEDEYRSTVLASSPRLFELWSELFEVSREKPRRWNEKGRVLMADVNGRTAIVYSVRRNYVRDNYYRGLEIVWSRNERILVGWLLPTADFESE